MTRLAAGSASDGGAVRVALTPPRDTVPLTPPGSASSSGVPRLPRKSCRGAALLQTRGAWRAGTWAAGTPQARLTHSLAQWPRGDAAPSWRTQRVRSEAVRALTPARQRMHVQVSRCKKRLTCITTLIVSLLNLFSPFPVGTPRTQSIQTHCE